MKIIDSIETVKFKLSITSSLEKKLDYLYAVRMQVRNNTNPLKKRLNPTDQTLLKTIEYLIKFHEKELALEYGVDKGEEIDNLEEANYSIKWMKSDKHLITLSNYLIEKNIITAKDKSKLIDCFIGTPQKSKPLNWNRSIALLTYFIEELVHKKLIQVKNVWNFVESNFHVDYTPPKNLKQNARRYKENKLGKPKKSKVIDFIIEELR